MKYLILIHSNRESRAAWESFSDAERAAGYDYYTGINRELAESGELIAAEALADASMARRVHVTDGRPITSDGPFAEVKEQLAGFFLVQVDTPERAVEIAARLPEAEYGLIEVRPILDLGGQEM